MVGVPEVNVRLPGLDCPGLSPYIPLKKSVAAFVKDIEYPPRITGSSLSSIASHLFPSAGRHAAPTLGATLFQSVL